MKRWQRSARLLIALFGIAFAVFVARELKRRQPPPAMTSGVHSDPRAVIETKKGRTYRIAGTGGTKEIVVGYDTELVYDDGSSKLLGVTIEFDERNGDRAFTITGKEGRLGKGSTTMALDGAVKMLGSDGMTVLTEHASYAEADAVVRAPGPVEATQGRRHATGIGMTWD